MEHLSEIQWNILAAYLGQERSLSLDDLVADLPFSRLRIEEAADRLCNSLLELLERQEDPTRFRLRGSGLNLVVLFEQAIEEASEKLSQEGLESFIQPAGKQKSEEADLKPEFTHDEEAVLRIFFDWDGQDMTLDHPSAELEMHPIRTNSVVDRLLDRGPFQFRCRDEQGKNYNLTPRSRRLIVDQGWP